MDYLEAFQNLKTNNKYSRKSPHKAVLLLTIIDLYESCELTDNVIKYDDTLKTAFLKTWNKVLPNEATFLPEAYLPFWFMQSEGFWHIVPLRGKEDILSILRDTHVKPSESKLKDCVNYAELDEALYFLMTLQSGRSSLKRALLETYTTLSTRMIEKLSSSSDNFVDNSETALNEYESILNSSALSNKEHDQHSDKDVEKRFYELSEDIQYVLNIEYYTFLKNNFNEREMFREICPTVFDLYDRIASNPIRQGEIAPSFSFTYENFLADLKINLMSEEGAFDTIDNINEAIVLLHEEENIHSSPVIEDIQSQPEYSPSEKQDLCPLTPALESRKGKPWTENEEDLISLYYKQGYGFDAIASAMGRTEVSIKSRLASLGLIDYSYEYDSFTPIVKNEDNSEDADKSIDFFIENTTTRGIIFNMSGEQVYSISGQLKIFNGKPYRFNYKEMCFTVKDIIRKGDIWDKGAKKIVSYENSDLYPLLDKYKFIDQIEDLIEGANWNDNQIRVAGKWYDFKGYYIKDANSDDIIPEQSDSIGQSSTREIFDFEPKGQLKWIDEIVHDSYDYLWLIAIIDFMGDKLQEPKLSYDNIACLMIANAWEILNTNPEIKQYEQEITECIEFLIEESHEYMDRELNWASPRDVVYESIKDYPMAGIFEDTVELLVENAPFNVLLPWIATDDDHLKIAQSQDYHNSCLYALHPRKIDPYIEINPKWSRYLCFEHPNLFKYYKQHYIDFILKSV